MERSWLTLPASKETKLTPRVNLAVDVESMKGELAETRSTRSAEPRNFSPSSEQR